MVLLLVNGFLVYFWFSRSRPLPAPVVSQPETVSYQADFANPRYDHQDNQSFFYVDVALSQVEGEFKRLLNCDTNQREGVGASIIEEADTSWTALIVLDNPQEKVTVCMYAPEGVFEEGKTVRAEF